MLNSVIQTLDDFYNQVKSTNNTTIELYNTFNKYKKSSFIQAYNILLNKFEQSINTDNQNKELLNVIKRKIDDIDKDIDIHIEHINNLTQIVNSKAIKPLELITRETIQEHNIQSYDPNVNAVLNQSYDVNRGGRRRRKKKTRKNKRY